MIHKINTEKLYNLAYITRYKNVKRIKDESVAEHSFFVAVEVLKLREEYFFDEGKALLMAITHDFAEAEIDDVNHMIKAKYPDIAESLKVAELNEIKNNYPKYIFDVFKEFEDKESLEAWIVYLADIIQCITYSTNEIQLGNTGYMLKVKEISEQRAIEVRKKIEEIINA